MKTKRSIAVASLLISVSMLPAASYAGGKLLATGGVTQFEGSAGGGLTPWAVIAGYGTKEEIGFTSFYTNLDLDAYKLQTAGIAVGINDRVELSYARQSLDVGSEVVSSTFDALSSGAVSSGPSTDITQDVFGVKVKLFGDAVYDQDNWVPQVSLGVQYKKNNNFDDGLDASAIGAGEVGVPKTLGAAKDSGVDVYVSATKAILGVPGGNRLLLNGTLRASKANSFGLLGFETAKDDGYDLELEGSAAYFVNEKTIIGYEFRTQPNKLAKLGGASVLGKTDTAHDFFVAYVPNKRFSVTAAYVDLGNLPFQKDSNGLYLSLQAAL